MARRKNATALFEVIQAGRKLEPKPAAAKSPVGWWFGRKDKAAGAAAAAVDPDDPTANVTAATLFQSRQRPAEPEPPEPAPPPPEEPPARDAYQEVAPAPVAAPVRVDVPPPPPVTALVPVTVATPMDPWEDAAPAADAPRSMITHRSGVQMNLDGDRQEVTVRMRYTTAVVSGFIVLLVVGLAYVVGRHMAEGPSSARADNPPSTERVKKGPAQPAAMDVGPRPTKTAISRPGDGHISRTTTPLPPPPAKGGNAANGAYADPIVNPDGTWRRVNNMNYLLIQRYPLEMQDTAREVAAFLTDHGIPCTVEKGSARTHTTPGWYCVVGTRGFPAKFGNSAEYVAYLRAIDAAAAKFPAKSKFDKVQPMPFKWTE